ncbi:helicase associated domain-containing protein [Arthrobacter sp. ISL-30]|uniref:helicase associated domain-containing protein n=1 Tax=Arthrobacter sp. ISL-30 TaxID=2819109 RepID=UPI001BED12A3|nr:helicase associated domain-containing protein [Arthrobacter sp. ISL-30]MBT2515508.1 helicase associated domain-containing protein [Arthrobacter sp. ISL-30]
MAQTKEPVPHARRSAPYWEWVEMYRRGIAPSKIADVCGAAVTTVRYHLQIAAKRDPGLRGEHAAALPLTVRDPSDASLQKMQDLVTFYQAEGRLPAAHAKSSHEQALVSWLYRRRRESAQGTLSPVFRDGLSAIPGWDKLSRGEAADEARWQQRLQAVKALRRAGGEWPRHQKTDDPQERTLGVWLHGQRINYKRGKLAREKKSQLDRVLPGWREGRPRGGRRAS